MFSGNPLDRGDQQRRDEEWIRSVSAHQTSVFLPVWNLKVPVVTSESSLIWLDTKYLTTHSLLQTAIFLGLLGDKAYFVVDVSEHDFIADKLSRNPANSFVDIRAASQLIPREESGILSQAVTQINWHNNHKFCSTCGKKTSMERGGQLRHCPNCKKQHFPRTDPVAITVVSYQDYCLLGRSRGRISKGNTFSALAGFIDQGESLEEAVAREIMEESGIEIENVTYLCSQPWPFPYNLMLGCHASAVTTDIIIDDHEMEDIRWFPKAEVCLAIEGKSSHLEIPGPIAIAHHLIKAWALDNLI